MTDTFADHADPPASASSIYVDLGWLALIGMTVLVALTFQDYGITNDEEVQNVYGIKLLSFYTSFFADRSAFSYLDLYRYGGLFDLVAALANLVSPLGEYETRHLLGGICGVIGLAGAMRLGRLVGGARVGLLALVLLALTPAYYGHSFNNPKDGPFAAAMIWTLYYLTRVVSQFPKPQRRMVIKFGVALGISLGTGKGVFAMLIAPYVGIALALFLYVDWRLHRDTSLVRRDLASVLLSLLPALAVAYVIMGLCWPWAVMNPLNPIIALFAFSTYPIKLDTLVDGTWVKATEAPRAYLPDYLLVNMPEIVLFGLAVSTVAGALWMINHVRRHVPMLVAVTPVERVRFLRYLLVALAAFLPVLAFIFFRPTIYNGIRHFLFVVPPIAVLAAVGVDRVLRTCARFDEKLGRLLTGILVAILVVQAWIMGQLHPDEYIYYNILTGGVKGAAGTYELDYWGNSLEEATKRLADFIALENGDKPITRIYKVAVCGDQVAAAYAFPEYLQLTRRVSEADFLISFTQDNGCRLFGGRPIISVDRFGVALSVVKDRRYLTDRNK